MTVLRLRFVHRYRDRHGRLRYYFRRAGFPRVALPSEPGSEEFMDAYKRAFAGDRLPAGQGRAAPGSVSALVAGYYTSAEWAGLAEGTKKTRRGILERFRAEYGDKPVARLEAQHVRRIIAGKSATPHAANNLLKVLRLVLQFAVEDGWIKANPARDVRGIKVRSEGFRTWSEEEIQAFERRWPVGTRQRLALALLLYTGQRRSDVVRMGRQDVREGHLRVRQVKTGARLAIPLHAELRVILAASQAERLTFLLTGQGKPFTPAGFGNWFGDAVKAADLPAGLSAHGLRKAAARRLAEAGCTPHQIAAITGHKTLQEIADYTAAVDQRRLAGEAMARIGGAKGEHRVANPTTVSQPRGENPSKIKED